MKLKIGKTYKITVVDDFYIRRDADYRFYIVNKVTGLDIEQITMIAVSALIDTATSIVEVVNTGEETTFENIPVNVYNALLLISESGKYVVSDRRYVSIDEAKSSVSCRCEVLQLLESTKVKENKLVPVTKVVWKELKEDPVYEYQVLYFNGLHGITTRFYTSKEDFEKNHCFNDETNFIELVEKSKRVRQ